MDREKAVKTTVYTCTIVLCVVFLTDLFVNVGPFGSDIEAKWAYVRNPTAANKWAHSVQRLKRRLLLYVFGAPVTVTLGVVLGYAIIIVAETVYHEETELVS